MEQYFDEKKAFTIVGYGIDVPYERCYEEIPAFWDTFNKRRNPLALKGMFGLCQMGETDMHYVIGDVYLPWMKLEADMEAVEIQGGRWAVFPAHGALPDALQKVNTKVWQEWVPAHNGDHPIIPGYSLEMYAEPVEDMSKYYSEIWVPLAEKPEK